MGLGPFGLDAEGSADQFRKVALELFGGLVYRAVGAATPVDDDELPPLVGSGDELPPLLSSEEGAQDSSGVGENDKPPRLCVDEETPETFEELEQRRLAHENMSDVPYLVRFSSDSDSVPSVSSDEESQRLFLKSSSEGDGIETQRDDGMGPPGLLRHSDGEENDEENDEESDEEHGEEGQCTCCGGHGNMPFDPAMMEEMFLAQMASMWPGMGVNPNNSNNNPPPLKTSKAERLRIIAFELFVKRESERLEIIDPGMSSNAKKISAEKRWNGMDESDPTVLEFQELAKVEFEQREILKEIQSIDSPLLFSTLETYFLQDPSHAVAKIFGSNYKSLRRAICKHLKLEKKALDGHKGNFRRNVDTFIGKNPEYRINAEKPIITKRVLALILSQDSMERRVEQEKDLFLSGDQLRMSLNVEALTNSNSNSAMSKSAPSFALVSRDVVRSISRIYTDATGVRFADNVFVASTRYGGSVWGKRIREWNGPAKIKAFLCDRFSMAAEIIELAKAERDESDVELIVAGGSIASLFQSAAKSYLGDVDFFFVSPSGNQEAASLLMHKIMALFEENGRNLHEDFLLFQRNETCTTVRLPETEEKYQFIHRLYPSAASVIGGFDLGYAAVMLHNYFDQLSFTHLGAWCHALEISIVDTSRRSLSYEHRLKKYGDRGVDVVFPGLDRDQVLNYEAANGKIPLKQLTLKPQHHHSNGSRRYQWKGDDEPDYYDWDVAMFPGTYLGTRNWYYAITGRIAKIEMHASCADFCSGQFFEWPMKDYIARIDRSTLVESKKLIAHYQEILGDQALPFIVAQMEGNEKKMEEIRNLTLEKAVAVRDELEDRYKAGPTWRVENPGAQWTSSFNPIFEHPTQFYGEEFYSPCRILVTDSVWYNISLLRSFSELWQMIPKDVLKMIAKQTVIAEYEDLFMSGDTARRAGKKARRRMRREKEIIDITAIKEKGNQLVKSASGISDYRRALALYREALNKCRKNTFGKFLRPKIIQIQVACLLNMSLCLRHLGVFDDALMYADEALSIDESKPRAHLRRAQALFELKRFEACRVTLKIAKSLDPDDKCGWMGLAVKCEAILREADERERGVFGKMFK